jgi:exodeoxyribonuclease V beta subunit
VTSFDVVTSPLRDGQIDAVPSPLLIEASAGSGKTWTLAHLSVRFMVEDHVEPDEILLVTFTRDAARELRGRVREHLDEVIEFLGQSNVERDAHDWRAAWARRWDTGATRAQDLRRARLCRANLDGLQARTIHSFAAVNTVGPAKGLGDDGRLWRQALAECWARWSLRRPTDLALITAHGDRVTLDAVARVLYEAGVRTRGGGAAVDILPRPDDAARLDEPTRAARLQRELALDVVHRFCDLLRQARRTSFADLVVGLADRVDRADATRFVEELRATFQVVMIDEFQDTDPLQWLVFRDVFLAGPRCRLVLVGDPKQAIYRFRSATVETFLEVRDDCRAREVPVVTLTHNYRSTPALVAAINEIFAGTDFHYALEAAPSEPVIAYQPARSRQVALAHPVTAFGERDAAVHLRVAPYRPGPEPTYVEVAAYVERARASGVALSEIAVLCASNEDCRRVHRFLTRRRIPATTSSDTSIFKCAAARQLRHLLAALASPEDATLTEALRATWFRGPRAEDPTDHGVGRLVTRLSGDFATEGVAALSRFLRAPDVQLIVAAQRDGERHLTDLAHLGELLTRECYGVTLPALVLAWLDGAASALDTDENIVTRRLETESDAVRVLTVHKAKGLEFDVVLLPDLVRPFHPVERKGRWALRRWVHDGRTVVDAGSGMAWGAPAAVLERDRRTEAGDAGEQRRLLYVALTRARVAAVAWVRLRKPTPLSGEFARLLLDREITDGGSSVVRNRSLAETRELFVGSGWRAKDDPVFRQAKADPAAVVRRHFATSENLEVMAIGDPVPAWVAAFDEARDQPRREAPEVARAPFFAHQRRRWSYSDVARDLKEIGESLDVELDEAAGADEAELSEDERVLSEVVVRPDVANVFGRLSGKRLGVVVHRVLERFVASGVPVERLLDQALVENGVSAHEVGDALATLRLSLHQVVDRPLGATLQGRSLGTVNATDVATEMRFLLALGDAASASRLADALAAVRAHDQSGPDGRGLFAPYLNSPTAFQNRLTEGYLVGSLDLTVRGLDGRYRVVDYKTDQLAGARRPYAPDNMIAHMTDHHYPLQALFYAVALHRFLRSRLVDYDPERHLAGVDYYFVRVVGDGSAEADDGLLSWPISPAAVVAASDALGAERA